MLRIGAPEDLTRTNAAVIIRWFRQAVGGVLLGVLVLLLGLWGMERSWGFLTFAFGLWFSLVCALRAAYLRWHMRS